MAQYGTAWIGVRADTSAIPKDIDQAVRRAGASVRSIGSTVASDIARTTAQAATGVAALGAAAGASLIKVGTGYNALEQSSLAAFETLLGTKSAAEEMQASLREFAKSSPFPRQAFIEGTQRLLAFGFEAEKVIPTLDGIQNAVAAAGGSATELSNIVEILAKVRSSAQFSVVDLNQLGNAGINAAKLMGESMGMTEQEFRDSIFGSPMRGAEAIEAVDALVEGMHRDFAGAAEGLKNTWVGAVDRIKGAWRDLGSGLVDPFVTKTGGGFGVDWANDTADALRHIEKVALPPLGPLIDHVAGRFDSAAKAAVELVQAIKPTDVARALGQVVTAAEKGRHALRGLEGVAVGAGIAVAGLGARSVLGPLGFLVPAISPITGVLGGLIAGSEQGREMLAGLGKQAGTFAAGPGRDLTEALGRLVREIEGPAADAIGALGGGLIDIATAAVPVLVSGLDSIGPQIGRVIEAFAELVEGVLPPLVTVVQTALPAGLAVAGAALEVVAVAAEVLADNAWLIVPALTAVATYRMGSNVAGWFKSAADGAAGFAQQIRNISSTRGVSSLTTVANVTRTSVGNLASSLLGGLNPAVVGVTAAVGAGVYAWSQYRQNQEKVKKSTQDLTRALLEQGDDVIPALVRSHQGILEAGTGMAESFAKSGWSSAAVIDVIIGNPGDWDKAVGVWKKRQGDITQAFEEMPASVRPFFRELRQMVVDGVLTQDDANKIAQSFKEIDQSVTGTDENFARLARQFRENAEGMAMSASAHEALNTALSDNSTIEEKREALRYLADAFPTLAAQSGIFLDASGELREEMETAALSVEEASAMLNEFGDAQKNAADESRTAADGVELTKDSVESLAVSVEEATEAVKGLLAELAELAGGRRDVAAAERAVFDAIDRAEAGAKEEGRTRSFDPRTEDGRKNIEEIGKIVAEYERLAEMQAKAGNIEGARLAFFALTKELERLRRDGIIPTDEALRTIYEDFAVDSMPIRIEVAIDEAEANLATMTGELEGIPGGPQSGPVLARVIALLEKGSVLEAIALLQTIPGILEAEEATVVAHADKNGIETANRDIDAVAIDREALIRIDIDDMEAERRMNALAAKYRALFPAGSLGAQFGDWATGGRVERGRSTGGMVWPGWWLVGERGPELLQMSGYGRVHHDADTKQILGDAAKAASGDEFGAALLEEFARLNANLASNQGGSLTINQTGSTAETSIVDLLDGLGRAQLSGRLPAGFTTTRLS